MRSRECYNDLMFDIVAHAWNVAAVWTWAALAVIAALYSSVDRPEARAISPCLLGYGPDLIKPTALA